MSSQTRYTCDCCGKTDLTCDEVYLCTRRPIVGNEKRSRDIIIYDLCRECAVKAMPVKEKYK